MSESEKLPAAFICHSSADKERFVLPFAAALREREGVAAWVDKWEMRPGDKLSKIFDELAKAEAVVPVLSAASVNADWLRAEIDSVVDDIVGRSKRIIPVVLDGLDKGRLPAILRGFLYVRGDDCVQAAAEVARGIFGRDHPEKPPIPPVFSAINRLARIPSPTVFLAEIRQLAAGNAIAQNDLGVMCYMGEGVPQDYAEAAKWFFRAAEQGDPVAQHNLGLAYHDGNGVPHDRAESARWTRCAAEQGFAQAQYNMGALLHAGDGVSQDKEAALKWLFRAAKQGYAVAECRVGVFFREGDFVPQDHEEAMKWFHRAAEKGLAEAQHNLGDGYRDGKGVLQNFSEAAKWYRRAAEQGYADAQHNLGVMFLNGKGESKSCAEAVKWFRRAAECGHAWAQFNLGAAYFNGHGAEKSSYDAYVWFSLAADGGAPNSPEQKERSASRLSADELAAAQTEITQRREEIQRKQKVSGS